MSVHLLDPLEDDRWTEFVERDPRASLFHGRPWLETLRRVYGFRSRVYTTAGPREPLADGLVVSEVRSRLTGRRLVSVPFGDHCEVLLGDGDRAASVLEALRRDCASGRMRYAELRPVGWLPPDREFGPGTRFRLHAIDLSSSIDEIRDRYHPSHVKRKLKRAEREGLELTEGRSGELLDAFFELFREGRRRHGAPPPSRRWFLTLLECLGSRARIWLASRSGVPLAAIFVAEHAGVHHYKYGGSDLRHSRLGATALVFDRAIAHACARGARRFDMGRSDVDQPGLAQFKDRWGAEGQELTYYRYPAPDPSRKSGPGLGAPIRSMVSRLPDRWFEAVGRWCYPHLA